VDELALLKSNLPALLHFEGIPEKWLAVGALDPLQAYHNAGTPGGVFCSPLAPPPSRLTAMLDPGEAFLRFTSADLPFHNGWARLTWEGPSSLLVSEELTLVAAPPSPCLLICNWPSTGPRIDLCPSQATVGKMAELIWTEPALNDLDVIADHIALHDLQAARSLVQRVFQHVGQLVEHPESGAPLFT